MIATGEHYRGPEHRNSRIRAALDKASATINQLRPRNYADGTTPWVNPIFIIAGSLGEPDFEGTRLGHFGKKDKGLVVEISMPQAIINARDLRAPIVKGLRMANAAAFHFFHDKGMDFPLREAEELVSRVEGQLAEFA
ncbi:hypothetical protein [Novosphingobium sp. BL-52-GroH]|uniref:hypothetical protein n=1 Tax=Novosphingobium sp. BL-52-GroH TaxID=3349877 RepID=UPI00384A5419